MKWEKEECILLIDLFRYTQEHSRKENIEAIRILSTLLNRRAEILKYKIGDTFRNMTGILMKLQNIEYLASDGKKGLSAYSILDQETYNFFINNPEDFKQQVIKIKSKYDIKKKKEENDFFLWMKNQVSPKQLSELSLIYSDIEKFCFRKKLLKDPLFQTMDLETLKIIEETIEKNKIISYTQKRYSHNKVMSAIHYYIQYVKSKEDTEKKEIINQNNLWRKERTNIIDEKATKAILDDIKKAPERRISKESLPAVQIVDFIKIGSYEGTYPQYLKYSNHAYSYIASWDELYRELVHLLYKDYPRIITGLMGNSNNSTIKIDMEMGKNKIYGSSQKSISDRIYLETNLSETDIVNKIAFLIKACDIGYKNVIIGYSSKNTKNTTRKDKKMDINILKDFYSSIAYSKEQNEIFINDYKEEEKTLEENNFYNSIDQIKDQSEMFINDFKEDEKDSEEKDFYSSIAHSKEQNEIFINDYKEEGKTLEENNFYNSIDQIKDQSEMFINDFKEEGKTLEEKDFYSSIDQTKDKTEMLINDFKEDESSLKENATNKVIDYIENKENMLINDFNLNESKENLSKIKQQYGDASPLNTLKGRKKEIIAGNFEFIRAVNPCNPEYETFKKYKNAYKVLGKELVNACINEPEKILKINKMLFEYRLNFKKENKFKVILKQIPYKRRNNKVMYYINAYTNDENIREKLKSICFSEETTISSFANSGNIKTEELENISIDFLEWCSFNIKDIVNILFEKIFLKEQRKKVVKMRANGRTLQQIGQTMDLTRERIRQIEKKAKKDFARWQSRNRILSIITAERNGDTILSVLEIEEYFGIFSKEMLFFLRKTKSSYYSYDSQLDMFIVGDDLLSEKIEFFIEDLPKVFDRNSIAKILRDAEEESLPAEIVDKVIEDNYQLTGTVYHRNKLTLTEIYTQILNQYYLNGIKAYDEEQLREFRNLLYKKYGYIQISPTDHALTARITDIGILCGRGVYKPKQKKYISKKLEKKIVSYIEESKSPIFLTNTLFSVFEEELIAEGINNKYYLQGILKELYANKFVFRRDYIAKDESETSLYNEVVKFIKNSKYIVSKTQIEKAFPGIPNVVLNCSIRDPNVLNFFGEYLYGSNLNLTNKDQEYLKKIVFKFLSEKNMCHRQDVFVFINRDNPELLKKASITMAFRLFSVLEYLFKESFQFAQPYIARIGIKINRYDEHLDEMITVSNKITISEIVEFAKKHYIQINNIFDFVEKHNDTHLLIDKKNIASINYIGIDKNEAFKIENTILNEISEPVSIANLKCIYKFENLNVPWTEWLIYSILNKWGSKIEIGMTVNQLKNAIPFVSPIGMINNENINKLKKIEVSPFLPPDNLDNIDELIAEDLEEEYGDMYEKL